MSMQSTTTLPDSQLPTPDARAEGALLALNNIEVMYDHVILVLKGLSMQVEAGKVVALLGSNGAGKSTTLKAISGLLRTEEGEVTDGSIEFMGKRIDRDDAADLVRRGIFHVLEGRRVFEHLTVEENLLSGAHTRERGSDLKGDMEQVFSYFPRLVERRSQTAGYLSGGEQQMLAIGRALMASPKLMMLDEPSLGLSPLLVKEVFEIIERINRDAGLTILLVEQNARLALSIADYGYLMEGGRIVLEGEPDKLRDNEDVKEFYLGLSEMGERKSYRQVKHYKRRKRWLS
jgi:branched-chain amino acid transport system ATP-binding protein